MCPEQEAPTTTTNRWKRVLAREWLLLLALLMPFVVLGILLRGDPSASGFWAGALFPYAMVQLIRSFIWSIRTLGAQGLSHAARRRGVCAGFHPTPLLLVETGAIGVIGSQATRRSRPRNQIGTERS